MCVAGVLLSFNKIRKLLPLMNVFLQQSDFLKFLFGRVFTLLFCTSNVLNIDSLSYYVVILLFLNFFFINYIIICAI